MNIADLRLGATILNKFLKDYSVWEHNRQGSCPVYDRNYIYRELYAMGYDTADAKRIRNRIAIIAAEN